jgi:hypothetical protein
MGGALTAIQQENGSFWTCGQERMIFFSYDTVRGCCFNPKTGDSPHLGNYGPSGIVDIDEIVNAKRGHLAAVRRGEMPDACTGCPLWQPNQWPESPYIFNDVNIGHFTACNTDCYYCRTNSNSAPKPISARGAPRLLSVLKQMVERGYIDPDAVIRFGGGEPTIHPEFEATVDYFLEKGRRFFLNTSGVKYSPAIERMLRFGRPENRLVISIDCASNETYKIIKRIDVGQRVWDNTERYAKIGPDVLELKYILLPENAHETGDFVRKAHALGVRRVGIDLDSNPVLAGISGSLTDEIVEGIAVLIHEAKKRAMLVRHSGSGAAAWLEENGHARVQEALNRILPEPAIFDISTSELMMLIKPPKKLHEGVTVNWGRRDDVVVMPLNSEPEAIYLQEGTKDRFHRIEPKLIDVDKGETCAVEVVARAAGRSHLMIELRDAQQPGAYTRAKYDLKQAKVIDCMHDNAAVAHTDSGWTSCQLTLSPTSNLVGLTVTLVDDMGNHIYQGTGEAGIHLRPLTFYANTSGTRSSKHSAESLRFSGVAKSVSKLWRRANHVLTRTTRPRISA